MTTSKIKNLFYHVGLLSQLPEDLRPPSPSEKYCKSLNDNKKNGWKILSTLSNSFSNSFENKEYNDIIHDECTSSSIDGSGSNDADDNLDFDQHSVKNLIKRILSVRSSNSTTKDISSNDVSIQESGYIHYDVFLGGSCGHTIWRRSLVIPYLDKRDISYYDPQRPFWTESMMYEEAIAKENSSLFLYVLDPETINAVSFLEIAYFASRKTPKLVVVFLDKKEWKGKAHPLDLPDRQRTCDLIELILTRHSVPLLTSINEALDYVDEMIIGDKEWKAALKNNKQRLPYLKIQFQRFISNSKKKLSTTNSLFNCHKKNKHKFFNNTNEIDNTYYCKYFTILLLIETIIFIFTLLTFYSYIIPTILPDLYIIFICLILILLINTCFIFGISMMEKFRKKLNINRYNINEKNLILPSPPIMKTKCFILNENGEKIIENEKSSSLLYNKMIDNRKYNEKYCQKMPLSCNIYNHSNKNKYFKNMKNKEIISDHNLISKPTRQSVTGSLVRQYPIGYDVFLSSSSSNELDWITQKAIPILEKFNLSHISSSNCVSEMKMPLLHSSSHILYYIPSYKTFLSGMIEVAYYIGQSELQVTVCVPSEAECLLLNYNNNPELDPQTIAAVEKRNDCYKMAFTYLKDMANRSQVKVYTNVEDAIKHIVVKEKRKLKIRKSHNFEINKNDRKVELPSSNYIFDFEKTTNCSTIIGSQSVDQLSYYSGSLINYKN
ncbi:Raw [Strongyloides ratti]|uniref:Raw n=1 Tax=Strongyloides ratti TaxID=34506 RepID=A0A090MWB5_STRRB|nr:Raw [Strongyloides ratti]CEF63599.1 Raw [Strongyloides ratti]